MGWHEYGSVSSHGILILRPQNLKSLKPEVLPRHDLLEIGPQWSCFLLVKGYRDVGAETGPEAANAAISGGAAGRGPARVEKITDAERRGRPVSGIQFFIKTDPQKSSVSD